MNLDRLISVLEAVAAAHRPVSAPELQKMTDLPRPTCYRLLEMLAEHQMLDDPHSTSRYIIGERLIRIALLGKTDADVCSATSPTLRNAAIEFGETVFISRFSNNRVAIIHVETPKDPKISYVHPGLGFRPMHACSCAKAIAAFSDQKIRDRILSGSMKSYTDHTQTNPNELQREFQEIRRCGFAECVEEIETGVSSVAAPVDIKGLGPLFSVGAIGPIRRFNPKQRKLLGEKLIEVAKGVASVIEPNRQLLSEL